MRSSHSPKAGSQTTMKWLHDHPFKATLLAFAIAAAVVAVIAIAFGPHAFANAWSNLHPAWLAITVCAELLAIPAYALAYRPIARIGGGPKLRLPLLLRVVTTGFGPFTLGGGFALDKQTLHAIADDEKLATVRVLGLGALEWALLAPAAWICALILLLSGRAHTQPSLLWSWTIAVPIGFGIGMWVSHPDRRKKTGRFATILRGIGMLHALAREFYSRGWRALTGAALYWTFEIAAFYSAMRFVGLRPDILITVLGYATGYALTRRSTPLAGAGTTEALLTFSLHWLGQPVPVALAAVVVYRGFNFVLPAIPALMLHPRVKPLLDAADAGRTPARRARRVAAAPLLPGRRSQ